jgi:hypothetical protein
LSLIPDEKFNAPNKKISTKMKFDEQHHSQKQGMQPTTNNPTNNQQLATSN